MKLFKWAIWLLLLSLLALAVTPFALVYLGIEDMPRVAPAASAGAGDVARLKNLLQEHDPRDLADGATREVVLSQRDINLGLGATPFADRFSANVNISAGTGSADISLQLPPNPLGEYFNAALLLEENAGKLKLDALRVGDTRVPGLLLLPFVVLADKQLKSRFPEYRGARDALHGVRLEPGNAVFAYQWDRALADRIQDRGRALLLPAADREAVAAYYREAARIAASAPRKSSLADLLQPLFALARQRSGGDSRAENRALLMVLGMVMQGASPKWLLGEDAAATLDAPRAVGWTLQGRGDLAQHFGISAALAVSGGSEVADAIGVFKELDDSHGGTGFSFTDLLADRAGVELGMLAIGAGADTVQRQLSAPQLREDDFMPAVEDLPEGLMELTFVQRYEDLDDARYKAVKDEVERRLSALALYR